MFKVVGRTPFLKLSAAILFAGVVIGSVAADVPPRTAGGQMLVPPPAHLDQGEIFHVTPSEDAQIVVTADAPLQRFVAVNRRAVGYVIAPFDRKENDAPFSVGFLRIPAAAFDVGSADFNDVLRGPTLLDATKNPEITVELLSVRDVKFIPESKAPSPDAKSATTDAKPAAASATTQATGAAAAAKAPKPPPAPPKPLTYDMTGVCRVTIKGKAIEKTLAIRAATYSFNFETMNRYPGDLITIRTSFEATLAELGLDRPDRTWALRIPDTLKFDVFLLCNTVPPEKSLDVISTAANIQRLRYLTYARDLNQPAEADKVAAQFLRERNDDPIGLLRLAIDMTRDTPIGNRNLAVAQAAARRASELTKDADVNTLHTLASICAERGDFVGAAEWEKKAIAAAEKGPPEVVADLKLVLERYEATAKGTAPRTE